MIHFIGGYPATKKTTFGNWLRDSHGFAHLDLEHADFDVNPIKPCWDRSLSARELSPFVRELSLLNPNTVVTWGFPHGNCWIPHLFRRAGVRLTWFDADHEASRAAWIGREGRNHPALEAQLDALRKHRADFIAAFEGGVVLALDKASDYTPFPVIAKAMNIEGF